MVLILKAPPPPLHFPLHWFLCSLQLSPHISDGLGASSQRLIPTGTGGLRYPWCWLTVQQHPVFSSPHVNSDFSQKQRINNPHTRLHCQIACQLENVGWFGAIWFSDHPSCRLICYEPDFAMEAPCVSRAACWARRRSHSYKRSCAAGGQADKNGEKIQTPHTHSENHTSHHGRVSRPKN